MINHKEVPALNAGTMADVAFLLLIFFLVVTTVDNEEGIQRKLAPPTPMVTTEFPEHLILPVVIDSLGQILVREDSSSLKGLKKEIRKFLAADFQDGNLYEALPRRTTIDESLCKKNVMIAKQKMDQDSILSVVKQAYWEQRLKAVSSFGPLFLLPEETTIGIDCSEKCPYDAYVEIQDELSKVIYDLRDEWCQQMFDQNYRDLDLDDPEDSRKILVARMMYPMCIGDVEIQQ